MDYNVQNEQNAQNQQNQSANSSAPAMRAPLSVAKRILCCAALIIFSLSIPVALFYAGQSVDDLAAFQYATKICWGIIALGGLFSLVTCRRPVYLIGFALCTLFGAGVGTGIGACTAALICATVAGGALFSDVAPSRSWLFGLGAPVAFAAAALITTSPLLASLSFLPLLGAIALGICQRRQYSLIVSTGAVTATLAVALIAFVLALKVSTGMPLSADGIRAAADAWRADMTKSFALSLEQMLTMPGMQEQFAAVFGENRTPEQLTEIAETYGTMALNLLPGMLGLALWCVSFISAKGTVSALFCKTPRKGYPAYATRFVPSLPTAIFYVLCLVGCLITVMIPQAELVFFVLLNAFLILAPMMILTGILDVIQSFSRPHFRVGSVIFYVISVVLLGVWILPVISVTGAFSIITRAIFKALEQKLSGHKGGQ